MPVGGNFTGYHGSPGQRIARLYRNGSFDNGLATGTGCDGAV